jgi:histidinol-phosphate aminotransferase
MAFSSPDIINCFYKVKPPYNISSLNQKEALRRLQNPEKFRRRIKKIKAERERLRNNLGQLPFIEKIFQSDANFLLVKVSDALSIYNKLIESNIIVRNRSGVVENCLRITTGTKNENDTLLKELKRLAI